MIQQENRPYEIDIPHLPKDTFVLMTVEGTEYVSHTFNFRVSMATEHGEIMDEDLLRKPVLIKLRREGKEPRLIHGIIQKTKLLGQEEEQTTVYYWEATIVPWLWFLTLEADCRHFINMTAVEIVKKVFDEHNMRDYTFKVTGRIPKREFTVQYRESSFNFISRMLEEEGIFYWFEHHDNKHQLILTNQNSVTQNCPVNHKLQFGKGTMSGVKGGVVNHMEQDVGVHTGKMSFSDYNFETSATNLFASTKGKQLSEVYDYPGYYNNKEDGMRYAKLRLEEQEARLRVVYANTMTTTLMPGYRFEVSDHFDSKVNTSYVVLSISISARQNIQGPEEGDDATTASFHFSAIPFKVPYRPPRRNPKPLIHGVQTAVVVGPAGNEIYCDKFGRVKVQFHWDRLSKRDENSSFWIRVSSAWAGGQWGQISLPRIGQEVIVSFLEGDPDRPIITGRVYNDRQMPPYALPADAAQSGIKSRSTKGGSSEDFNEFRFDDTKGNEKIYLHAQMDLEEYIENSQTTTVRDGNQTTTLEKGDRIVKLKMGSTTNTMDVGNYTLKCTAGKISMEAAQSIEFKVGGTTMKMTPTDITLQIGAASIKMDFVSVKVQAAAGSVEVGPAMVKAMAPMIMLN
jgi:type VI secretion system secreted protein VgrG